jgi:hypothetical protein
MRLIACLHSKLRAIRRLQGSVRLAVCCTVSRQQRKCGSVLPGAKLHRRHGCRFSPAQGIEAEIPQTPHPNLPRFICVPRGRGVARKNACRVCRRYLRYAVAGNSKCFSGLCPGSAVHAWGGSVFTAGICF